jgi:hypothetical protein
MDRPANDEVRSTKDGIFTDRTSSVLCPASRRGTRVSPSRPIVPKVAQTSDWGFVCAWQGNAKYASRKMMTIPVVGKPRAWFRICHFRVTRARGNRRPVRAGSRLKSCSCREAVSRPGSGSPGLKWPEAQQGKPVRMALAGQQFPWAFAGAPGTAAAHETTVVQEESRQVQI